MAYELYWKSPSEAPASMTPVIVEGLNGTMYADFIGPVFYSWGDDIVRWAYFPEENYAKYQNALSDVEYFKEENKKLKEQVYGWHNKYMDIAGKYYNERQRDAFVGSGELYPGEFDSRSDNSDGDEHLTEDDLCELLESKDARPIGEVSVDELRDIFLKVLREAKERERTKAADEDDGK